MISYLQKDGTINFPIDQNFHNSLRMNPEFSTLKISRLTLSRIKNKYLNALKNKISALIF